MAGEYKPYQNNGAPTAGSSPARLPALRPQPVRDPTRDMARSAGVGFNDAERVPVYFDDPAKLDKPRISTSRRRAGRCPDSAARPGGNHRRPSPLHPLRPRLGRWRPGRKIGSCAISSPRLITAAHVMEILLKLLASGGAAYAALLAALFAFQGTMLYFPGPGRESPRTPAELGLAYEAVWLTTEDGVRIAAWYIPAAAARGVVLLAHGNAGSIAQRVDYAPLFQRLGYSLLLVEYRGYGRSEGQPSEAGTYADARAAWRYLVQERGYAPPRIVLAGESLGGAVAAQLATEESPGALVLASTFVSVPELAAELYRWLPARQLARYRYDTLGALSRVSCPVFIAHSPQDDIVPFHHAEQLFAAAREPKAFLQLAGGHNAAFLFSRPEWGDALGRFLSEHLAPKNGPANTR